eukprot:ANDGO_06326.mRNA.1 Proteasome subunit beta type-2-A
MADTLIGVVGSDFVLLAADASQAFSIVAIKDDEDKIKVLDSHKAIAMSGEPGDRNQFGEYIQKNLKLHTIRSGLPVSTDAAANYIRGQLAKFLRQSPYQVNMLIGGFDEDVGPSLYFMDYMASMHQMKATAQGYGSYFVLSTLDSQYREGMNFEQALEVINKCIREVKQRLVLNTPRFFVKVMDRNGVRIVDPALVA